MTTKRQPRRRRRPVSVALIVWGSFLVGIAGSLGFNIASTVITNGIGPSIAVAMLWPLLNLGAVALMIHVPWRKGPWWTFARFGPTGVVAVISFVISYMHTHHVMTVIGEHSLSAMSGPFAIDALMLLAGVALVALHAPAPTRRRMPAARRKAQPKTQTRVQPALSIA